jgi:cytochrome c
LRFADAWRVIVVSIALIASALGVVPTANSETTSSTPVTGQERMSIILPLIKAERGRRLFVTKGCVICHSVRGVGGRAGPVLDAKGQSSTIDILDFVARMWRGAPIMFKLQEMELGYRVELSPAEIADLAGFVSDARVQRGFSLSEVPEAMREWMVNERYWEDESADWRDKLPDEYPDPELLRNR